MVADESKILKCEKCLQEWSGNLENYNDFPFDCLFTCPSCDSELKLITIELRKHHEIR